MASFLRIAVALVVGPVTVAQTCNTFELPTPDGQILMGCVSYDPAVGMIWDKMKEYFHSEGVALDYVLFSNYEQQVKALIDGHIDIAWNGPIAHVLTQKIAAKRGLKTVSLGMRDVDRVSHWLSFIDMAPWQEHSSFYSAGCTSRTLNPW